MSLKALLYAAVAVGTIGLIHFAAFAQNPAFTWNQWYGPKRAMLDLINEGYDIKAAVPAGKDGVRQVYLQKGASAYICVDFFYAPNFTHNGLQCTPLQKPEWRKPE
jgi:hypothetical protein